MTTPAPLAALHHLRATPHGNTMMDVARTLGFRNIQECHMEQRLPRRSHRLTRPQTVSNRTLTSQVGSRTTIATTYPKDDMIPQPCDPPESCCLPYPFAPDAANTSSGNPVKQSQPNP